MTDRCGLRRARKGDITDWLLSPWMPLGKQWPHTPKWSLICRPEWHLFFPQQGSTFSYFTSRGDFCHRKWIRGLVFLRWHSSIGGLRLHVWEVETNCVLLGHLAGGSGGKRDGSSLTSGSAGSQTPSSLQSLLLNIHTEELGCSTVRPCDCLFCSSRV